MPRIFFSFCPGPSKCVLQCLRPCCVTRGKSLHLSEPLFPNVLNGRKCIRSIKIQLLVYDQYICILFYEIEYVWEAFPVYLYSHTTILLTLDVWVFHTSNSLEVASWVLQFNSIQF